MDGATVHIVVEDRWLVALNAACVTRAAAEDAGPPCLPGAVSTFVAVPVTSIAPEVVQSLPHEVEGPGQELPWEEPPS